MQVFPLKLSVNGNYTIICLDHTSIVHAIMSRYIVFNEIRNSR